MQLLDDSKNRRLNFYAAVTGAVLSFALCAYVAPRAIGLANHFGGLERHAHSASARAIVELQHELMGATIGSALAGVVMSVVAWFLFRAIRRSAAAQRRDR